MVLLAIPEIQLGYKPVLVIVFTPIDQGLEPFVLHFTGDHSAGGGRLSGHALCHLSYVRVSVQLVSKGRERVKTFNIDKGHMGC